MYKKHFKKGMKIIFGKCEEIIIPEKDIMKSYNKKGSQTFVVEDDGKIFGGAIVVINKKTQINDLHILYVKVGVQSKGVGYFIWNEIEKLFPETKIWKTCTPYFDKRNIKMMKVRECLNLRKLFQTISNKI